jgi:MoaA/NifB/PqqE/SkfB family radical SAM enzyme
MKKKERLRGLVRSPKLLWDILVRGNYNFTYDLMAVRMRHMKMAKRLNLLKAGSLFVYRHLKPWNWPLHVQVELTNFCNLRCPVCPTGIKKMNRSPLSMAPDLFERLMNEISPYLLTVSLWAWGEPLLHPQLAMILHTARRHRIATLLSTNGQNLYEEAIINALVTAPPTFLIVAIDGLTEDTHSKFRVNAKLDPILTGVRRLAEIRRKEGIEFPKLHMRYMVMEHNEHELPSLRNFAQKAGFDLLTIRTLSIIDSSEQSHRAFAPHIKEFDAYEYQNGERLQRNDFICQQPFWFPTIFSDGTVVACEQDYNAKLPYGKLSEDTSFAHLWFGDGGTNIRRVIRDTPEKLSFCRNCPYRDRPAVACSIKSFVLNNNIQYPVCI